MRMLQLADGAGATGGERLLLPLRRCCTDKSSSFGFDSGTDAIISSTRGAGGAASCASMATSAGGEEPQPCPGALFCVGGRPSVCLSAPPSLSKAAN